MANKSYFKQRSVEPLSPFREKFESALKEFSAGFLKSDGFQHALTKGEQREVPVQDFFREHLPNMYEVTSGEVVDLNEDHSPQLDLLIYDHLRNFPFYSGDAVILPAEALLVSVEVKSRLNVSDIESSLRAAEKIKSLKPNRKPLGEPKRGDRDESKSRFFHCIFAYGTDLEEGDDWLEREFGRFRDIGKDIDIDIGVIDRVYVANRGILNLWDEVGVTEEPDEGTALMYFYMHALQFMNRENKRRDPAPYLDYAGRMSRGWEQLS